MAVTGLVYKYASSLSFLHMSKLCFPSSPVVRCGCATGFSQWKVTKSARETLVYRDDALTTELLSQNLNIFIYFRGWRLSVWPEQYPCFLLVIATNKQTLDESHKVWYFQETLGLIKDLLNHGEPLCWFCFLGVEIWYKSKYDKHLFKNYLDRPFRTTYSLY